jgi:hypothetical protein
MTLGERCDEIVRLIDETLGTVTTPPAELTGRRAGAGDEVPDRRSVVPAALAPRIGRPSWPDGPTLGDVA